MVIPPRTLGASEFLYEADKGGIVIDVRSPIEFSEDHIPGAVSWPLFLDSRILIGGGRQWGDGASEDVQLMLKVLDYGPYQRSCFLWDYGNGQTSSRYLRV